MIAEQVVELAEGTFPVFAVALQPGVGFGQRLSFEARRAALGVDAARDQPRALQHFEVLRDRRLTHRERRGELGDRRLAAGELRQDRAAGRIGERGEGCIEAFGGGVCITSKLHNR